jgi:DNA repair protein RadC
LSLKLLPQNERPRERLARLGANMLSNQELISILVGSGNSKNSAFDIAGHVLRLVNSVDELQHSTMEELEEIDGIGRTKAINIIAAIEFGKRVYTINEYPLFKITSPKDVYDILKTEYLNKQKEIFIVIYLNTKNEVISKDIVSIGSLNSSIVHPREVFKDAIRKSSNSIILAHNHPSGNPTPSVEDINITKRLIQAGDILGIKVIDHVIIGKGKFTSLKEEGIF